MAKEYVTIGEQRLGVWYKHAHIDRKHSSEEREEVNKRMKSAWIDAVKEDQVDDNYLHLGRRPWGVPFERYFRAVTICQLEDKDRNVIAYGYAFCSREDNFNKAYGRKLSRNRAIGHYIKSLTKQQKVLEEAE